MKLTKRMKEILGNADLEKNEINNVTLQSAYGLVDRGLIPSDWDKTTITETGGNNFPIYHRVKLTEIGRKIAYSIKETQNKFNEHVE